MTDTTTLIEALKAAGHEDAANSVRDRDLAGQLRNAGHERLADQLEGRQAPTAPPGPQATVDPRDSEAEYMLAAIKRDLPNYSDTGDEN